MSIDAMKQALETIDWLRHHLTQHHGCLHMEPTSSGIPAWLLKSEDTLRHAIEQAEKQEPVAWPSGTCTVTTTTTYAAPPQQEKREPVVCEPQPAVTEDGYCDWVCPNPASYLMQCCDCGLIHEVQTRVAKYEPLPSEVYEVVSDPDVQAQWRMRRRDDISPQRQPLPAHEIVTMYEESPTSDSDMIAFARAIERKNGIGGGE